MVRLGAECRCAKPAHRVDVHARFERSSPVRIDASRLVEGGVRASGRGLRAIGKPRLNTGLEKSNTNDATPLTEGLRARRSAHRVRSLRDGAIDLEDM